MDSFIKQLYLISIFFFPFFIKENIALLNCSMVNFSQIGTEVARSESLSFFLRNPIDVFVDKNNTIYILERDADRVQIWQSNATSPTAIINATYGYEPDKWKYFSKMHVDTDGNVYLLDIANNVVAKWAPGAITASIVAGNSELDNNESSAYNAQGMFIGKDPSIIWIVETHNNRIVKWSSPSSSIIVCSGTHGSGPADFNYPTGIFVDENDHDTIYVVDTWNHRVQQWKSGASAGKTVAGQADTSSGNEFHQLSKPTAVVVDANKNIYVSDTGNRRIMRWRIGASSGEFIVGDYDIYNPSFQLNNPHGLCFDADGSLYVADFTSSRVQKFTAFCSNTTKETSTTLISSTTITTTTTGSTSTMQSSTSNAATPVALNILHFFFQNMLSIILFSLILHYKEK